MWNKSKKILGYAWASPMTLIGLAYAHMFTSLGWYEWHGTIDDALVWQINYEKMPRWLQLYWYRWEGQALGNVVVLRYKPEERPSAVIHELKHVDQSMRLGIFHPIVYAINLLAIKIGCKGSDPYYSNPFEIDARRQAGQTMDVEGTVRKMIKINRHKKEKK